MKPESSETVFRGRVFDLHVDHLVTASGQPSRVDWLAHPGSVTIIPMVEERQLIFIKQYRHAVGMDLLELPAGTLEPGERPDECARRETGEEIGYLPGELERLGSCFLAPGYSNEETHIFLARALRPVPSDPDFDEQIEIVGIDFDEVPRMVARAEIRDAKTLAALALAEVGGHLNLLSPRNAGNRPSD